VASVDGDLPPYLIEPDPPAQRQPNRSRAVTVLAEVAPRPAPWSASPRLVDWKPAVSPIFLRMVPLNRGRLAAGLEAWWVRGATAGAVTLQRRLQLGRPLGSASAGWTMKGRVRRLTPWHWVPVVVEVWPMYDDFARMTMTPQARVYASKRYFRLGNSALDRLCTTLAEVTSADS
jgi:hypothetical protein